MNNACENRVRKRYAELNENGAKMHPKWEPEIVEILKNTGKKASQNRCDKKGAEWNRQNVVWVPARVRLGSNFGAGGGGI